LVGSKKLETSNSLQKSFRRGSAFSIACKQSYRDSSVSIQYPKD
jgi:hypothetical protein